MKFGISLWGDESKCEKYANNVPFCELYKTCNINLE